MSFFRRSGLPADVHMATLAPIEKLSTRTFAR